MLEMERLGAEISLQQAFESLAVTSLVASHLVNGVMDSVEVGTLRRLGKVELAGARAVLGLHTHLEVLLGGIGHNFAQELGKLRGMLSLFVSSLLPVQADLRIALAMSNASHGQIHADLGALAVEVGAQIVHDVLGSALC